MNSNKPTEHLSIQELREAWNCCHDRSGYGCKRCPNLVPGSIGTVNYLHDVGACRMDLEEAVQHVLDTYIPQMSIGAVEYITRVLAGKMERLTESQKEFGTPFYDAEINACNAALMEVEKYRHAMEREADKC